MTSNIHQQDQTHGGSNQNDTRRGRGRPRKFSKMLLIHPNDEINSSTASNSLNPRSNDGNSMNNNSQSTTSLPYHCDWIGCDKKFNQSCNLNKHLLTHTGL